MKYEIVKLADYSGNQASIYTIRINDEAITKLEEFVIENINDHEVEVKDILTRLKIIGHDTGARTQYFKEREGVPGDQVCALFDEPDRKLRLYCIRIGSCTVILGGGGVKPKNIKAFQEDPKLKSENSFIRRVSQELLDRRREGDIYYTNNGLDLEGDLIFNDYEED